MAGNLSNLCKSVEFVKIFEICKLLSKVPKHWKLLNTKMSSNNLSDLADVFYCLWKSYEEDFNLILKKSEEKREETMRKYVEAKKKEKKIIEELEEKKVELRKLLQILRKRLQEYEV